VKDLSLPVSLFFCTVALGYVPRSALSVTLVCLLIRLRIAVTIFTGTPLVLLVECFAV
jgi:hypothetical protein